VRAFFHPQELRKRTRLAIAKRILFSFFGASHGPCTEAGLPQFPGVIPIPNRAVVFWVLDELRMLSGPWEVCLSADARSIVRRYDTDRYHVGS
jgi:hypothetical protein